MMDRIKLHVRDRIENYIYLPGELMEIIRDITCMDRIKLHISTTEEVIRRYNMYGSNKITYIYHLIIRDITCMKEVIRDITYGFE